MGYTHYWYRPETLEKEKFAKAAADCKKVAAWLKIPVQVESDEPEEPVFSESLIRFNGVNEDGHDTFVIPQVFFPSFRQEKDGKLFAFCKTARKPYDTLVTACLTILKHYFDDIDVKSDGYAPEWEEGVNAVCHCLGYGNNSFIKEE